MKTEEKKNGSKAGKNEGAEQAQAKESIIQDNAQKETKHDPKNKDKEIIADLTDSLQRLQAEFENYKKRVDKENQEFVKYAKAEIIRKMLGTIDTFEIALRNTTDHEKFVKGMEMIYAQMISTLETEGLKRIEAVGRKFDPYLHEVMLKQKSDKESGIILEELQKGYLLNGRVLRFSMVKISEKNNEEQKGQ